MADEHTAESLGYIRGVVERIEKAQGEMKQDLATHMANEEKVMHGHDKRIRVVETKVHTSWIIGGGFLVALGAVLLEKIKLLFGIHG